MTIPTLRRLLAIVLAFGLLAAACGDDSEGGATASSCEVGVTDVKFYPAECVLPPDGVEATAWIEGGMKGAKCN